MQVTSKGQVTVPVEIRERLGIQPGTEVEFEIAGDTVVLRKTQGSRRRGRSIVARMRGRATVSMTTAACGSAPRLGHQSARRGSPLRLCPAAS